MFYLNEIILFIVQVSEKNTHHPGFPKKVLLGLNIKVSLNEIKMKTFLCDNGFLY